MAKGGNRQKKFKENPKKKTEDEYISDEDVGNDDHDDEIDAFHKQRDVIPLDVNDDMADSDDEDIANPVMDLEGLDDEDEDEDDYEDEPKLRGIGAKIERSLKYMQEKFPIVDDESDEEEEEKELPFGNRRHKVDEFSDDEEGGVEEEKEVLILEQKKAKTLKEADFMPDDIDEDENNSDVEPTLEEISVKGKVSSKFHAHLETQDGKDIAYEEIKKDHGALTREEQMDVVYSSAPEIVGLLSELNSAYDELEGKVNPLLNKVDIKENTTKGGMHYLEVKRLLLLSYSQAITFYLLLKSEGHSVREHPVLARIVEMKNLVDKMKQLDENLPASIGEIINLNEIDILKHADAVTSEAHKKNHRPSSVSVKTQETSLPPGAPEPEKADLSKAYKSKEKTKQTDQVGKQSMEMLKIRADLEAKYKQKGMITAPKHDQAHKHLTARVNGQLQSLDDFDDEVVEKDGHASKRQTSKLSELVRVKKKKPKVISGDDDLPKRDDIGERRRKNELRVLAKAGGGSIHDDNDEDEDGDVNEGNPGARKRRRADIDDDDVKAEESEDEFYKQVKQQRDAKLSAKAQLYSRTSAPLPLAGTEEVADGKRHITTQMEKNRGLTRPRNKSKKNPRTNYKNKHNKAVMKRKGQVRDVKKPMGPYGGEVSGINAKISRSTRFKS
ncbi:something about silencing protein 10-like [Papaver somniferum]|uniref:something about silencing protein 10-like n=1 Tax=Papaver somniferum TaxID=3469 RepID=UPI000E705023|nr:something about silencing protein 10-like [Papaver somniferum]